MLPVLLAFLLTLFGCAAPHDNPLDPKSDHYVAPAPEPHVPDFSANVWSEHVRVSQFSESYQLFVAFHNPDTTFALDSVWMVYNGWMPRGLQWDLAATWANNFDRSVFQCGQQASPMACVIGVPFDFYARSPLDSLYHVGPVYLFRVIRECPATLQPAAYDTVGPVNVALEWNPYSSTFGDGYGFQVELLNTADTTVHWTSALLAREQYVTYPAPDSLPDALYYWTVSVLDSFGNSAQSPRAYFNVRHAPGPL